MVSRLIFYRCEQCRILYKIHIKKGIIRIDILGKLYNEQRIFNLDGFLVCIECKHENKLKIQKVFP